jgi:hypothetical protein
LAAVSGIKNEKQLLQKRRNLLIMTTPPLGRAAGKSGPKKSSEQGISEPNAILRALQLLRTENSAGLHSMLTLWQASEQLTPEAAANENRSKMPKNFDRMK